jgi:DNA helicase HerA-like ATPase
MELQIVKRPSGLEVRIPRSFVNRAIGVVAFGETDSARASEDRAAFPVTVHAKHRRGWRCGDFGVVFDPVEELLFFVEVVEHSPRELYSDNREASQRSNVFSEPDFKWDLSALHQPLDEPLELLVKALKVQNLEGEFEPPLSAPINYSPFFRPAKPELFKFLDIPEKGIILGTLMQGGKVYKDSDNEIVPVSLYTSEDMEDEDNRLMQGIAVFGRKGYGKTVLVKNILQQAVTKFGVAAVVVDPQGEYDQMSDAPTEYDDMWRKLDLEPKGIPVDVYQLKFGNLRPTKRAKLFSLRFREYILDIRDVLRFPDVAYLEWPRIVAFYSKTSSAVTVTELYNWLLANRAILMNNCNIHESALRAVIGRLEMAMEWQVFDITDSKVQPLDIVDLIKPGTLTTIQTNTARAELEQLIVLRIMGDLLTAKQDSSHPRHEKISKLACLLAIDEAHRYFPRGTSNDPFLEKTIDRGRRIARESRKYRLGLLFASQNPSDIHQVILGQCWTKILFGHETDEVKGLGYPFKDKSDVVSALLQGQIMVASAGSARYSFRDGLIVRVPRCVTMHRRPAA